MSRTVKKILSVITVVVIAITLSGCGIHNAQLVRYEYHYFDVFDTFSTLTIYTSTQEKADELNKMVHDSLQYYHKLFDIHHTYEGVNNIATVNNYAGIEPVKVDVSLIEFILYCKDMYQLTNGHVNIAMGAVISIWHESRMAGTINPEQAELPDRVALIEAMEHISMDSLIVDEVNATLYLSDSKAKLDVGAIAKGYVSDRITEMLIEKDVSHALLTLGGNVSSIGGKPDGTPFLAGIQDPRDANNIISTVQLNGETLVTSGDYQRYYMVDGKRYHHIINPKTGYPPEHLCSVSVIAKESGLADALSTALFIIPVEQGLEMIENIDGVEAYFVDAKGTVIKSKGFH